YRAQYYKSVRMGEKANKLLVSALMPLVLKWLARTPKRTCSLDWVRESLSRPSAKVWIHQGHWLRYSNNAERCLSAKRWANQDPASLCKCQKRKLRYGGLCPARETRINLMGAFLTLVDNPSEFVVKSDRGRDIHEFGFS